MKKNKADHLPKIQPKFGTPMSSSPICVALPIDLDEYVRSQPNRAEWLRKAIAAQVERDKSEMASHDEVA
jgi:hypothetical protein